ncbi:DUF1073 domain-containing protein [Vulcanococcus limneticus Candia 3F8]|uniref:anti-CBASS protein Acb1 family protein n=1 Tax=Vulcanococcus limneticus TaxID=2170428 RepID=UPI000B98C3E9|nr:anti-CBASS Acb1 family protein [Vulcanococcus limneticus]MCP9791468.1 DUF1073 domain-containing protein [Vulcanococcus limneticus MW73D5]MCP9893375.1 DUF1073 domain-containing protein [Vulcanococcus limneticus Candia 3F8]MCP9896743.1 DUF1073 domain-containing protein [Vulcanococcus limneticus Candia 3B3]
MSLSPCLGQFPGLSRLSLSNILDLNLELPWNLRVNNTGWGQSVIEVIWDAWQDYVSSLHGLNALISEGDLLVHNMPGLMQRIAAGGEDAIRKRLELNRLSRSVYGTYVLDKEETLSNLSRNLTNIASATEPFVQYLQAVTGWPASILMGTSPGGLGKEGRFEERVWASLVEEWQSGYCQDPVTQIFTYILAAREGPAKGRPPEDWEVHFPSVFTQTDEEKATLRKLAADSDTIYAQLGVLQPIEIRQARFGSAEFSLETPLNDAVTEQLAETTAAQFETQMLSMAAQREMALAPPEDAGAQDGAKPTPAPDAGGRVAADALDTYEARGLRIQVTHTAGDINAGPFEGAINLLERDKASSVPSTTTPSPASKA